MRGVLGYGPEPRARKASKPKPRQQAGAQKPGYKSVRSSKSAKPSDDYAPGKLRAAQSIGVRPGAALAVAAGVIVLGLLAVLFTGQRLQRAAAAVAHAADVQMAGFGFKVGKVHIEGASPRARADILRASALYAGEPILGLDLNGLRARIEQVGWVKDARVARLLPGVVAISVTERKPAAVWQMNGKTRVVDAEGQVIPEADPANFVVLPLVVGEGADEASTEIMPLVRARPRLMDRLEALVRVDGRRWDLRLKDGTLIALPAEDQESALIQLDRLDHDQRILDLSLGRIDLRDPGSIVVRPRLGGA
jgi:cell division protein FtsQ